MKINPLVIAGFVFLLIGVLGTTSFLPLASIGFGELEATGLSSFSVINTFIGIVLVILGMRRKAGKALLKF